MVEKKQHIDVCIASYKRPQLLARLLTSIAAQKLPEGISLAVIVVDNDPDGTARGSVESAAATGLPIQYFIQPKKNIALTRNMGVANSVGEYIAFIDDDEYAEPDWLNKLYETLQKYQAGVVFGPVIGILPSDAPKWISEGGYFKSVSKPTGSELLVGATNNALVRASHIDNRSAPFNPKYGLTGGEDADFFRRLRLSGAKLVWCNEAVVREAVTPDRLSAKWLIRRAYWGGQVFAEINIKPTPNLKKIPWFIYRTILALIAFIGGLLFWPIRRAWGVKSFQKAASNIGQVSSIFGYRFEEYGEK